MPVLGRRKPQGTIGSPVLQKDRCLIPVSPRSTRDARLPELDSILSDKEDPRAGHLGLRLL